MPAKFVKSIGRTLDARPDRLDLRDREFTPSVVSLPDCWPHDEAIRKLIPQYCKSGLILDQGEEGACTGFGLACVVNYLHWRVTLETGIAKRKHDTVSPRMLYHLARFYDEWPGEDYDGSSNRGALKAWHKHGVCAERFWPYRDARGHVRFVKPLDGWSDDALTRRLGVYYRVNHASVVDMQAAILQIGAIYVSSDVHDGWALASNKPITGHASLPIVKPIKKHDSLGGHAFALVGFNRTGFVLQNSWGMKWGACGFAVLPYDEWVRYGTDAWIAALGVPAHAVKFSNAPVRSKTQTALARSGAVTFTTSSKPKLPQVAKEVACWASDEAYQHAVVMGNDGLAINRILTHEGARSAIQEIACDAPLAFFKKQRGPKRVVVYAHGGLNSEDAAVERVRVLAPYFKANGVYPIFLIWKTGPTETLTSILEDELKKIPRREGDFGEIFDRVKETAAEVLDRTIEVLAGPAAKPIWSQMKQNAQAASDADHGCATVADALAALTKAVSDVEIHFMGHSAGSIILGYMLNLMQERKLKVSSCHLYAPACTVRLALERYVPALENGTLDRKRWHIHVLSDDNETCDKVGPYCKSLLYLVSRALENCHKMPILGMQQVFDAKANPKWNDGEAEQVKQWQKFWSSSGLSLDIVSDKQVSTGSLGPKIQAAHGSFDNDATTIGLSLKRITGADLSFPIEWIDY